MPYTEMFDAIAKKAEQNSAQNEVDYIGEDGLLVCGYCHTAKQARIPRFVGSIDFGEEKVVSAMCKCEAEKWEEEKDKIRKVDLIRKLKIEVFPACKYNSNPENDMSKWTFENDKGYQPELIRKAINYVKDFENYKAIGKGMLLYGETGVGKSYAAACIANALVDKGISVIMTSFAFIASELQGAQEKKSYYNRLNNCSLLILDDLAAERDTEYMKEIVHTVIDNRLSTGLPMIITSNLTNEELRNPASMKDKRLFSRLSKACHPVLVKGDDLRKRHMVESYAEMERLLNQ